MSRAPQLYAKCSVCGLIFVGTAPNIPAHYPAGRHTRSTIAWTLCSGGAAEATAPRNNVLIFPSIRYL